MLDIFAVVMCNEREALRGGGCRAQPSESKCHRRASRGTNHRRRRWRQQEVTNAALINIRYRGSGPICKPR